MKLFVILSRVPYPIEKGDKLRAYHQLKVLSKKHDITLCALSDIPVPAEAIKELEKYCSKVYIFPLFKPTIVWNILKSIFNGTPFQTGYFYSCKIQKEINKILKQLEPDHIFCQLIRVSEYVKNTSTPKTLDYMDVFSMGVRRRMLSSSWWLKPVLKMEYKRLLKYEHYIFEKFSAKSIISEPDRDLIPHPENSQIAIIPNGVDYDYFFSKNEEKLYDLVFTGNMGYPPNIDAACFLAQEITPLLKVKYPEIKILIAGATPHAKVNALKSKNITVSGWIPDIRTAYDEAKIFIAPMRIGTGLQNKILEAMAMSLPCVTTTLPNQALNAKENSEILVGNTAQELATAVISLLENQELTNAISKNGHAFVKNHYSWEASTQLLENLFVQNTNIE